MRNILAVALMCSLAAVASAELIGDGDFSDGTLQDTSGGGTVASFATGVWASATNWSQGWDTASGAAVYDDAGNNYNKGILQYVDIAAGDYEFQFDVMNLANPQWGAYWYVGLASNADNITDNAPLVEGDARIHEGNLNAYLDPNATEYTTVTLPFTVSAAQASTYDKIVVGFTGNGPGPDGPDADLRIDNVSLVIPEPATMSLLALGGLAALRRRRR
jgi:hypothetical protein